MPIGKPILPNIGVVDQLGSLAAPWQAGYFKVISDDQGNLYAKIPISANSIQGGSIGASLIASLLSTTVISDLANLPLLTVINQAALGAQDPVSRINAGVTLIDGSKVQGGSFNLGSINPAVALAAILKIATGGAWQTDDYVANSFDVNGVPSIGTGFKIGKGVVDLALAAGVLAGVLIGTINIAHRFRVDANGNAVFGDPVGSPNNLHGIDANGREWWGSNNWTNAPLQVDVAGNIYISDGPNSLNYIALGAIDATCQGITPSQAGGQLNNGNLTLTAITRGASIYYTTDGSDPSLVTNGARTLYTGPIPIVLGVGQTLTVKAVATKLGCNSQVFTWVFTGDANTCAQPTAIPPGGLIVSAQGNQSITLQCGTVGATITYTLDGTTPIPGVNGTIYVGPFFIGLGQTTLKAIASKAGLANSTVLTTVYNVTTGGGGGGGGGHRA